MNPYADIIKIHQDDGPQEALPRYLEYHQKKPDDDLAHLIGICYAQLGQAQKALDFFNTVTQQNHTVLAAKANTYLTLGDLEQAEKFYTKSLQMHPHHPNAHNSIGRLYIKKKQYDRAIGHLTQATLQAPKVADYHYNLAIAFLGQYSIPDAIRSFRHSLSLDNSHATAWSQLGLCYETQNNHKKSLNAYKKAWSLNETADAAHGLGRCYTALGDNGDALLFLNKAIAMGDESIECHHNLASVHQQQGHHQKALLHWHYCLERQKSEECYYNIACAYQNSHNYEQATAYFTMLLKINPKHLDSYLNLAAIALDQHQSKKAIYYYKEAIKINPECEDALFVLSALTQDQKFDQVPDKYVKSLFDQYASHYDRHLSGILRYQLPKAIEELCHRYNLSNISRCCDLGCGTGLVGAVCREFTEELIGVDISGDMLQQASAKGIYDTLIQGNILSLNETIAPVDLVVAADLIPYFGDLADLFLFINRITHKSSRIIFSFEQSMCARYKLHRHVRFAHGKKYVEEKVAEAGWGVLEISHVNLREQQKKPVSGYLAVCTKEPSSLG